jgi:hypothetical protein
MGMIMFVVFGYALIRLYWYLPSWLDYLRFQEILVIVAYMLSLAFLESVAILGVLIFFSIIIPRRFFFDRFSSMGFLIVAITTIWAILLHEKIDGFPIDYPLLDLTRITLLYALAYLLSIGVLAYVLIDRIEMGEKILESLADRMAVFTYIYLPLSVIGFITVIFRGIFNS